LLDDFDFDAQCQVHTPFGVACLSSNPTSFGSPSTRPSSKTSCPRALSQLPTLLNANGCGLADALPSFDLGYIDCSTTSENAGKCGRGTPHFGACTPNYELEFLAESSAQIQHQSIPTLAYQDQYRLLRRTSDYYQQAQHPSHSSGHLSSDCDWGLQPTANVCIDYLQMQGFQATNGNVPQPQPLKDPPMYDTYPGPVSGIEQRSYVQAQSSGSKSNEPDATKLRRQRNSAAARKYQQRRLDRIEELGQALQKMQTERDELKVQVARWKGKAEALQSFMARSGVDGMERSG
jgi:Basic region leucine zipper